MRLSSSVHTVLCTFNCPYPAEEAILWTACHLILVEAAIEKCYRSSRRLTRHSVSSGQSGAMFTRICIETVAKLHVDVKTVDHRDEYKLTGWLADFQMMQIDFLDVMFVNRSYHFTDDALECANMVRSNKSDFASINVPIDDPGEGLRAPLPFNHMKTSMLTGYLVKKVTSNDFESLLGNFKLIDPLVYLLFFTLFVEIVIYTILRTLLDRHHSRKMVTMQPIAWLHRAYRPLKAVLVRHLHNIVYLRSRRFRFISLLLSLTCFFIATGFSAVYSVSRIITEQPLVTRTYQMLLENERASAFFYDQLFPASGEFKYAPANSVKGKIWSKRNQLDHDLLSFDNQNSLRSLRKQIYFGFDSMNTNKSVVIAKTFVNLAIKNLFCAFSPEDQLWRLFILADDSEKDQFLGWVVSPANRKDEFIVSRLVRLMGSGILQPFKEKGLDEPFKLGWLLSGSSVQHRLQQQQVCRDDFSVDKLYDVPNYLTFTHFKSSAFLQFSLLSFSWFALASELILAKCARAFAAKRRHNRRFLRRFANPRTTWTRCTHADPCDQ